MLAQKPSSSHLQSTNHILQSTFQNLFAQDKVDAETIRNLSASRRGDNDYHDKYVERLLGVHNKWSECTSRCQQLVQYLKKSQEDARILEQKEEEEKVKEFDSYSSLGLPPVNSKLKVFIDDGLLKNHSLINPNKILCNVQQLQASNSERELVPQYESSTYQSRQLFDKIPPDDCYKPRSPAILPRGSNVSDSHVRVIKKGTGKVGANGQISYEEKNIWRSCINPLQREIEKKDLANLQKKANFLKNPRLVDIPKSFLNKSLNTMSGSAPDLDYFKPFPCPVVFTDYKISESYEIKLELKNITSSCRQVRILQPSSKHFTVSQGEFPLEDALVAPGMSCTYTITFTPDTLGDFDDVLVVKTQAKSDMCIPLTARRVSPQLTLPKLLSSGFGLVGDQSVTKYSVRNNGGTGRFYFVINEGEKTLNDWDAEFTQGGCISCSSFSLTPASFSLDSGEAIDLQVTFEPDAVQVFSSKITLHCDNCTSEEYLLEGCGEMAHVELSYVQDGTLHPQIGEMCDKTAEKIIQFGPHYPGVACRKQLHISNTVSVPLQYQWDIMLPDVSVVAEQIQAYDSMFSVETKSGFLPGSAVHTFDVVYHPQQAGSFYHVAVLKLLNIPVRQTDGTYTKEEKVALKLSLKGSTKEYCVEIFPPSAIMAGKYFISQEYFKSVSVRNLSSSPTTYKCSNVDDDMCTITVEPCEGVIEACSEVQCQLAIRGKSVGEVRRVIPFEIPFSAQRNGLHVECAFSGPVVSFCEMSASFGLVRFGQQITQVVTIANSSPISAYWAIDERCDGCSSFSFSPNTGVLAAASAQEISVTFSPTECRTFQTLFQCVVENGASCYLPVHAEVLRPNVYLEKCEISIEEAFLDVTIDHKITMTNSNFLAAQFDWNVVSNDVISFSCEPKSGVLEPQESLDVNLQFCLHQLGEVEQFITCTVAEMLAPLVLSIQAKVYGLHVELTMPNMDDIRHEREVIHNNEILEFGVNNPMGELVDAFVIIENKSAIETTFTMTTLEFVPLHTPTPPSSDISKQSKSAATSRPLITRMFSASKTPRSAEQEKAKYKDAVLQSGKGLAFVCSPSAGKLLPFETKIVTITAYTDMWGEYFDTLVCQIGDADKKLIPIHIDVVGCPLNFQICKEQPVMVRFGAHVSGDRPVVRNLRINNTSHCDVRVDWQTFIVDRDDDHLIDLKVYIGDPFPILDENGNECESENHVPIDNNKFISVLMEEHSGNRSNVPFSIPNTQVLIPGKGSGTIDLCFNPPLGVLEETKYLGYALGYMSLLEKDRACDGSFVRAQGIEMMPFSLNTTAAVTPARLYLETCDEGGFEFAVSASDLLTGEI